MVYISYAISKKQSSEHTYKVCAHWISHCSTKKKKVRSKCMILQNNMSNGFQLQSCLDLITAHFLATKTLSDLYFSFPPLKAQHSQSLTAKIQRIKLLRSSQHVSEAVV